MSLLSRSVANDRRVPPPLVGVAKEEEEMEEEPVLARKCRLPFPLPLPLPLLWPAEGGRDGELPEGEEDDEEVWGNMGWLADRLAVVCVLGCVI